MRLAKRLSALLKRRGCRLTEAVRDALTDFVATVYEHNPTMSDPEADADEDTESAEALSYTRPITCPHCGETIDIAVDLSSGDQDHIQDCEVCCSPIRIVYTVRNGALESFSSEAS